MKMGELNRKKIY